MQKLNENHVFLLRVYRDTRAFKSTSPALMLDDLKTAWGDARRAPGDLRGALKGLIVDGLATASRFDDETVIELTEEGVRQTWLMHNPAFAARRMLSQLARRVQPGSAAA